MGVAVFSGMIGVTVFGLFLTPVFYVLLRRVTGDQPLSIHSTAMHCRSPHPTGSSQGSSRMSPCQGSAHKAYVVCAAPTSIAARHEARTRFARGGLFE